MSLVETTEYPTEGYPRLELGEVFKKHGIVHGLSELDRRSVLPPSPTANAEIAAEIIHDMVSVCLYGSE